MAIASECQRPHALVAALIALTSAEELLVHRLLGIPFARAQQATRSWWLSCCSMAHANSSSSSLPLLTSVAIASGAAAALATILAVKAVGDDRVHEQARKWSRWLGFHYSGVEKVRLCNRQSFLILALQVCTAIKQQILGEPNESACHLVQSCILSSK